MKEWSKVVIKTKKKRINWILIDRDWSSDQNWVVYEEAALYSWDLRKLHYGFSFYSLVLFFIFLN